MRAWTISWTFMQGRTFETMIQYGRTEYDQTRRPANESLRRSGWPKRQAVGEISDALRRLLADVFALYLKTKNFHWHMTGNHFRDYHLLLDEQGEQIFTMTDDIAERARKIGGTTLHSMGDVAGTNVLKTTTRRRPADGHAV